MKEPADWGYPIFQEKGADLGQVWALLVPMDAQVPLGYCKRERWSRFPHTPTHIPSPPGATNQRSATQSMNCLQHVMHIYILVNSNWYQFRTGHSWST